MTQRRLPAEWEPQDGVLLGWPHPGTDWFPVLDKVEPVFAAIAAAITQFEPVVLIASDRQRALHHLSTADAQLDRVHWVDVPTNDTWARDFGPITVYTGQHPLLMDFVFNGWGGKFEAALDNQVTQCLHLAGAFADTPLQSSKAVLEGGSIESDGAGTLLTTARCLLHPGRNPQWNRTGLEQMLQQTLGIERVLWLEHGHLEGDDTDAHIDTLARFAPGDAIVYVACDDPGDSHFAGLQSMATELSRLVTRHGRPYRLLPLPWPRPVYDTHGTRLPATYANFLVVNGGVLVPTYDDPADSKALAVIAEAFPDRAVVGIPCLPLLLQHGSLHCLTMQLPQGVLP